MPSLADFLTRYGESHQHRVNKAIHWVCVPAILFTVIGLLFAIPFPGGRGLLTSWAAIVLALCLLYYLRLSVSMCVGFGLVGGGMLWANYLLFERSGLSSAVAITILVALFVVSWIGQFIGHKIEGKRPSFLQDVQFLLIGPAWLLHFVYKKVGIRY